MNKIISGTLIIGAFVGGQLTSTQEVVLNPDILDEIEITVKVKETTKFGTEYQDAIHYSTEQFAELTPERLEKDKQDRVTKWEKLVEEQSKLEAPIEVIEEEINEVP